MARDRKKGLADAGLYLFGNVIQRAITFLLVPLYTRYMSTEEYGALSFSLAILGVILVLISLGLDASVVRLFYDYRDDKQQAASYLSQSFFLRVLTSVLSGAVCLLVGFAGWGYLVDGEISLSPFLLLIVGCGVFQTITDFITSVYRAKQEAHWFVCTKLGQTFLQAGLSIWFVVSLNWGASGPLWALFISAALVSLIGGVLYLKQNGIHWIEWTNLKHNFSYGVPTIPQKLGNWITNFSDRVVIAKTLTLASLGIYQLGCTVTAMITVLVVSINSAYVPYYYGIMKSENPDRELIAGIDFAMVFLFSMICSLGIFFPDEIARLLGPEQYADARYIIPLILYSYFVYAQYTLFLKELHFHKRTGIASLNVFIPGLLIIPINIWLIPRFGIMVAVVTTLFAYLMTLMGAIFFGKRIEPTRHPMINLIALNVVMAALAVMMTYFLKFPAFSAIGLSVKSIGFTVFALFAFLVLIVPFSQKLGLMSRFQSLKHRFL